MPKVGEVWRLGEVEGRGLGLLATQDLQPGDLVLQDLPLFIVPDSAQGPGLDRYLADCVARLEPAERQQFFSLADCKSEDDKKTVRGIYFTNCYTLGSHPASPTAMLPRLSRVNHSCRPNTEFHWDAAAGREELRAARPVRAGEELTDCYLDLTAAGRETRAARRALLRGGWFNAYKGCF